MGEREERVARYKRALETVRKRADGFPVSEEDARDADSLIRESRDNSLPRAEAEELLAKVIEHLRTKKMPGLPPPGRATEDFIKRNLDERDRKIALRREDN